MSEFCKKNNNVKCQRYKNMVEIYVTERGDRRKEKSDKTKLVPSKFNFWCGILQIHFWVWHHFNSKEEFSKSYLWLKLRYSTCYLLLLRFQSLVSCFELGSN